MYIYNVKNVEIYIFLNVNFVDLQCKKCLLLCKICRLFSYSYVIFVEIVNRNVNFVDNFVNRNVFFVHSNVIFVYLLCKFCRKEM